MRHESRVAGQGSRVASHESRVTNRRSNTGSTLVLDPGPGTRDPRLREARGFTLFELVVVIIIARLVGTVFLNRLRFYQEMAEKASMEYTLRIVKTGLQIRLAELIIANRQADANQLETENPMSALEVKPENYAGDYREPPARGNWYFDVGLRQLVYVVNNGDYLEAREISGVKQLRFEAKLVIDRIQFGGSTINSVSGVVLFPVHPYRWS